MSKRKIPGEFYQLCARCKKKTYPRKDEFSFCESCGAAILSRYHPAHKLCPLCAQRERRCEQCGALLDMA